MRVAVSFVVSRGLPYRLDGSSGFFKHLKMKRVVDSITNFIVVRSTFFNV